MRHTHYIIQLCSFILIYNMRPENKFVAYFKGFEFQNLGTMKVLWMESIYSNMFPKCFFEPKKFDLIKFYIDLFLWKEMVSCPKTFDVSKSGKMTELTQTEYRFGILVEFTYNIACQTGFENSSGNTTYDTLKNFW